MTDEDSQPSFRVGAVTLSGLLSGDDMLLWGVSYLFEEQGSIQLWTRGEMKRATPVA
jgi:hypothetical protein